MKKYLLIALVLLALNVNATNYRVHAETMNGYGSNYAVELVVDATDYGTVTVVNSVYYWTGEEYIKLNYRYDTITRKYCVYLRGEFFYFSI